MTDCYKSYQTRYRRLANMLLLLTVCAVAFSLWVSATIIWPPRPSYYVTTSNGTITPVFPLSDPIVTNDYIVQWAGMRARDAFSFNFFSWHEQLEKIKPFFTTNGYSAFNSQLQSSNMLGSLKNNKLIISSVVTKTPVIMIKGVRHGSYMWKITMPLLVTFTSASVMQKVKYSVTMVIQRVPVMDQSVGIAINTFVVNSTEGTFGQGG